MFVEPSNHRKSKQTGSIAYRILLGCTLSIANLDSCPLLPLKQSEIKVLTAALLHMCAKLLTCFYFNVDTSDEWQGKTDLTESVKTALIGLMGA